MKRESAPLVSVVIPVWRPDETHWRNCLASVLAQTHQPLEVMVADNDPDHGVAKKVVEEMPDDRLRYLPNPDNPGIFRNLNFALRHSKGAFIQIFCQDDRMLPNLLEGQLRALDLFAQAGFVYSQWHAIDETGQRVNTCEKNAHPYLYFSAEKAAMNLFKYGCLPGNLSAVMIRRQLLEVNGFFEEELRYASDFKYWAAATRHGGMAVCMEPLFEVRRHSKQASRVLGADLWLQEAAPIYHDLYERLPQELKNWKTRMYANEHFGQNAFLAVIRQVLIDHRFSSLKNLHHLQQPPFSLPAILFLTLFSLRNTVSLFKMPEVDFYADSELPLSHANDNKEPRHKLINALPNK